MANNKENDPPALAADRARTPQAQRALEEAQARRATMREPAERPVELAGRAGPEPVRYGDWENKGIATDF